MQKKISQTKDSDENGFSLIEAVIAIFIITVGLLGTAAAITYSLEFGAVSRNVGAAKLIIVSTIEEIESLRNTRRLDFKQIANVGRTDNTGAMNAFSGFSNGWKEISIDPGPDGVSGTDDDLRNRGADNTYGTADDFDDPTLVRSGYVREIIITDLNPTMKKIVINIRYYGANGKVGTLSGVCYLNDEARLTR